MKTSKYSLKKLSLMIFIPFLISLTCSEANSQSKRDKIQRGVDSVRMIYEGVVKRTCPSLSILIHTPDDYIFVSSEAGGENNLSQNTHFRFASNTKSFTSASILNMQEDGWLNIKDKIVSNIPGSNIPYVPNTPEFNIPYKDQITIEQLLQHSAGVYDVDNDTVPGFHGYSYTDYMDYTDPTKQFELWELVNQAAKNNLSYFPPGTGFHYSNTGYTILSEIIERVYSHTSGSPKKYADYIKDYITGSTAPVPLNISFPYLAWDVSVLYPTLDGNLWAKDSTAIFTNVNMSSHVGEGNGYATFAELDNYVRTLMKGENVLNKSSVSLMQNSVSEANKTYGLGCINIKDLGYGHNGCIKGYLSYMLYDPVTDISVIIMMNVNDYRYPDETGIIYGLKALINTGYTARRELGFPGMVLDY